MLVFSPAANAFETDQFTHRQLQITDSQSILDHQVNLAIGDSILGITDPSNKHIIINRIYRKLGGLSSIDKIESWAMHSDQIERLPTTASDSIYAGIPFWATRITGILGIGATIKVNGVLLGTDKLGHFFSQGRKFYVRWLRMQDIEEAAELSAFTEGAIFGQMSTGSYSNADLVANYEGFKFYRALFEGDPLTGKPAILSWQGDHWIMQRPFKWSDYVNDYWDEALNINRFDRVLYPYMKERLLELCDGYLQPGNYYRIQDEDVLKKRYKDLQLKDTSELRLNNLCVDAPPDSGHSITSGNS